MFQGRDMLVSEDMRAVADTLSDMVDPGGMLIAV